MKRLQTILLFSCPSLMGAVMFSILWATPEVTVTCFVLFLTACFGLAAVDELISRRDWRAARDADAAIRAAMKDADAIVITTPSLTSAPWKQALGRSKRNK